MVDEYPDAGSDRFYRRGDFEGLIVPIQYRNIYDKQIVPYYELDGCILTLENFGYERAFSVVLCKKLLDEAKEQYEIAKSLYETACNNPLIGETEV